MKETVQQKEDAKLLIVDEKRSAWKYSEWECHLFGSTPGDGIHYRPLKKCTPNWFVRKMSKLFFDCTWVRDRRATVPEPHRPDEQDPTD